MPLPALHERFVPAAAKMASTPELSLRGPEGAVAISGRQRRSLCKAAAREKNVAALSERLGQLQITGESVERTGFQVCHCEEAQPTWQSRGGTADLYRPP